MLRLVSGGAQSGKKCINMEKNIGIKTDYKQKRFHKRIIRNAYEQVEHYNNIKSINQ